MRYHSRMTCSFFDSFDIPSPQWMSVTPKKRDFTICLTDCLIWENHNLSYYKARASVGNWKTLQMFRKRVFVIDCRCKPAVRKSSYRKNRISIHVFLVSLSSLQCLPKVLEHLLWFMLQTSYKIPSPLKQCCVKEIWITLYVEVIHFLYN